MDARLFHINHLTSVMMLMTLIWPSAPLNTIGSANSWRSSTIKKPNLFSKTAYITWDVWTHGSLYFYPTSRKVYGRQFKIIAFHVGLLFVS